MTSKDSEMTREVVIRPSSVVLWITIIAGPFSFAVDMESRFALVQWACGNHRGWVLPLIAVTALVAAVLSALVAWSAFTRLDRGLERARFMAMAGFILSSVFALAIVANAVPHIFLHACD